MVTATHEGLRKLPDFKNRQKKALNAPNAWPMVLALERGYILSSIITIKEETGF